MIQVDLLITARWVLPVEPSATVLPWHTVVVHQGRIEAVLPREAAFARYRCETPVERSTHVLLPGLINAYTQAASVLMRAARPRSDTALAVFEQQIIDPDYVRDATQIAIAAMLRAGVTCFADADLYPQVVAQTAAAAQMRVCVGLTVGDVATDWAQSAGEYLEKGLQIRDEYRDDPLITTAFAPAAAAQISDETLQRIRRAADEIEAPILMPLERGPQQGEPLMQRLERLCLLTPLLAAVHPANIESTEIDAAVRTGINLIHCARDALVGQRAHTSVHELQRRGINIGLGTGNAGAGYDLDVLQELRLTSLQYPDLSSHEIVRMGTLNAARALGLDAQIGSLTSGKAADLCCIDLANLQTQPLHDPAIQLVRAATRDQVSDVWVAGRHLLNAGQLTRMNIETLLQNAATWSERITAHEIAPL
jgi:5-methylthioadenosine/S-adenosylhomocysteine deaminase